METQAAGCLHGSPKRRHKGLIFQELGVPLLGAAIMRLYSNWGYIRSSMKPKPLHKLVRILHIMLEPLFVGRTGMCFLMFVWSVGPPCLQRLVGLAVCHCVGFKGTLLLTLLAPPPGGCSSCRFNTGLPGKPSCPNSRAAPRRSSSEFIGRLPQVIERSP